jgi:hypothetical protein
VSSLSASLYATIACFRPSRAAFAFTMLKEGHVEIILRLGPLERHALPVSRSPSFSSAEIVLRPGPLKWHELTGYLRLAIGRPTCISKTIARISRIIATNFAQEERLGGTRDEHRGHQAFRRKSHVGARLVECHSIDSRALSMQPNGTIKTTFARSGAIGVIANRTVRSVFCAA